jgi:hypothetical protein
VPKKERRKRRKKRKIIIIRNGAKTISLPISFYEISVYNILYFDVFSFEST